MVYLLTWAVVLLASTSAVVALVWAVHSGQFADLERGAEVIFDEEDLPGPSSKAFEPDP